MNKNSEQDSTPIGQRIRETVRLKISLWRMHRAVRRRKGHERERRRLERKYESESEIPLPLFVYELLRSAVVGLKLKVKP